MDILMIEDEPKTAEFLRQGLTENGFGVRLAADGDAGLQAALAGSFALVVLDVMLPGRDGWAVLAAVRATGGRTPVLLLTARDDVADKVKGLDLGADDYLVKPFAFAELLARIRSILRRSPAGLHDQPLRVGDLELDLLRQRATRSGKPLELSPKEFVLLSLLARRHGEVMSRPQIAEQVWGIRYEGGTNYVDVHVRRLRAKVDDDFPVPLIHTVRGVGYVLRPPS